MKLFGELLFLLLSLIFYSDFFEAAVPDKIQKISELSSSKYIEFSPSITGDGQKIVFQRMIKGSWAFYESTMKSDGNWKEPQPIDQINKRFEYVSGPSISYNGKNLYFTAYQETDLVNSEDIFVASYENGQWQEPQNLGKPVNSFHFEGYPSISPDEQTIYFMRENQENEFDKDHKVHCFKLYSASKGPDGKWQEPQELPYPVNFNCERNPRILYDQRTLMFSSIRADGSGKFDIYASQIDQNGIWSDPNKVDYLNTDENDQSPCLSADGTSFFYYTDSDIYSAEIPELERAFDQVQLKGKIIDAIYKVGLSVNLEVVDPYNDRRVAYLDNTESDGLFSVSLYKGRLYHLNIIQDHNFTYTFPLDLTRLRGKKEYETTFELFSNLNLKFDVIDISTGMPISSDLRINIRMDRAPLEDTYILKFHVKNYQEASSILKLQEIRKNPDFRKTIELQPQVL